MRTTIINITKSYHMDPLSRGFVEILAAEQTPDNPHWFQGTADAVRQAARHFTRYEADYYLILVGDHLYRMDYARLLDAHIYQRADITIAALPVTPADATGMGLFLFDRDGQIIGFEEKPDAERLSRLGASTQEGGAFHKRVHDPERPFVASLGIYLFSRQVLLDTLKRHDATDFGREIIPASLERYRVSAYLHDGYWADVGTIESFYEANILLTQPSAPFKFYDPRRPIFTHERFLPPLHFRSSTVRETIVADGCFLDQCTVERSVIGIRTHIGRGTRISRSVLLGADYYPQHADGQAFGIGRDVILDRVIIDKNARIGDGVRIVNAAGVQEADRDGYFIRNGIIIVPKEGRIEAGTVI